MRCPQLDLPDQIWSVSLHVEAPAEKHAGPCGLWKPKLSFRGWGGVGGEEGEGRGEGQDAEEGGALSALANSCC